MSSSRFIAHLVNQRVVSILFCRHTIERCMSLSVVILLKSNLCDAIIPSIFGSRITNSQCRICSLLFHLRVPLCVELVVFVIIAAR